MFTRWQDLDVDLFCTDCGAPARSTPPAVWNPTWGQAPPFSHHDGQPLCRTQLPSPARIAPARPAPRPQRTRP